MRDNHRIPRHSYFLDQLSQCLGASENNKSSRETVFLVPLTRGKRVAEKLKEIEKVIGGK